MGLDEEKIAGEIDLGGVTASYEDAIRVLEDLKARVSPMKGR